MACRVNQLSAISSRARGPRRIRPELWVEPPPISFCQILFDRIGWAGGAGSAAVAAAAELGGQASPTPRSQQHGHSVPLSARAETPEEWIVLGARVHGAFGAFIPLGIKIGLDAVKRLNAKPRELAVLYYDSDTSPCACFADGIAIATYTSVGQRTLTVAREKSPPGTAAVIIIRPRQGGAGFKYTIPVTALAQLGPMNKNLDPRGRYDAVMAADGLFQVEPVQ
jgi:hypothetical protein